MADRRYPQLLQVRIDAETHGLARVLAAARKCNVSTLVRQLIDEEGERKEVTSMATATDYESLTRNALESTVGSLTPDIEVPMQLDIIAHRLREHDGWVSWAEIVQAVHEAALSACKRRRAAGWDKVRQAVEAWAKSRSTAG